MNTSEITFPINEGDKIVTHFDKPLEYIGWNYNAPVKFLHNKKLITLANGPTYFNIRDFRDQLSEVINKKLALHESITKDIGFLYNYFLQHYHFYCKIGSITTNDYQKVWSGSQYYTLEAYENEKRYVTWLYNDKNGNITFTITPIYTYDSTTKRHMYIPYKKWILRYKPYYTAIISKETAQKWYNQADMIVKAIDKNVKRWEKEHEKT
jgi:hypothetical protein